MAVSPDGVITCDCCGVGTLEIKCPFCARDEPLDVAEIEYLSDVTNKTRLKENHAHYYQFQAQIVRSGDIDLNDGKLNQLYKEIQDRLVHVKCIGIGGVTSEQIKEQLTKA